MSLRAGKAFRRLTAGMVAAFAVCALPSAARAFDGAWETRARLAIAKFEAMDSGSENAHAYSYMAYAIATLDGWSNPLVGSYLERTYALQNPDGGYGLGVPDDAFDDGSVNPADTTYTVTVANHVGRALLVGYENGAVPASRITRLVDIVAHMPHVPGDPAGVCIAYSAVETDTRSCVNNVNATAGRFLIEARRLGLAGDSVLPLVSAVATRNSAYYDPDHGWWPYRDAGGRLNDFNHNASSIEGAIDLTPSVGAAALPLMMARTDYTGWTDPLAQIRLLQYDCSRSAELLPSMDAMLADDRETARLMAQMALWAARTAVACGPDRTAPSGVILSGPPARTASTSARVAFGANEELSRFTCLFDDRHWKRCTSPLRFGGLAHGPHLLRVRAIDAAGNVDPTPAEWSWTVGP